MAVNTLSRADKVSRQVELEALSLLISAIAEMADFERKSGAADWGNLLVGDGRDQPSLLDLLGELWPEDEDDESPEFDAAAARAAAIAAALAAWLASADGQDAMSAFASTQARAAARWMENCSAAAAGIPFQSLLREPRDA